MHYFDYAATTKMSGLALEAYMETAKHFYGNSESLHDIGTNAHAVLEKSRALISGYLGIPAESIYFTSGGTEGNLLAILSLAMGAANKGKHIISSMAEHASVHSALSFLEQQGFEVTRIPFTKKGTLHLDKLEQAIRPDTVLVSIQHLNQEIGTIQPIGDISRIVKGRGILFHSDCVQSFGKADLNSIIPFVDSITVSSHKIHGPKGVGAVYIHPSCVVKPVFSHLSHEKGIRGGTVNVPGIAGFAVAVEDISIERERDWAFRNLLKQASGGMVTFIEGAPEAQLPSLVGCMIPGVQGQLVLLECNKAGFAISTGSACQEHHEGGSKAVEAMGYPKEVSDQFFRISFGRYTTKEEVVLLGKTLKKIAAVYGKIRYPFGIKI
ncbi:cysteine desulfurase [Weizmannia acidilactici]|uniref:Cysteine desulfurase n=1 Tax=Weizmannia acidilactici TaxID=2607726 RepID=A0A5J4JDZ6_9BACI|nr:IscS subfamily cysteine desulfurase [Weizmannia acidilactici]GER67075.1 cysteine desulfurase [Weizmannia acidilactici]GER70313.1 cysteine desulfurase [Weizmannia acidilactici]GER73557.1 cysteine desulfurase [Weizmannia acidilactici]